MGLFWVSRPVLPSRGQGAKSCLSLNLLVTFPPTVGGPFLPIPLAGVLSKVSGPPPARLGTEGPPAPGAHSKGHLQPCHVLGWVPAQGSGDCKERAVLPCPW